MYASELNKMSMRGEIKAYGTFTYDSMGKKLRFRSNETSPSLDLLMFFEEVTDFFFWKVI